MVGIAEVSIGQPSTDRDNRHWKLVVIHVIANLFCATKDRKISNRINEGVVALGCHPRRETHHVLFGDTSVNEPIRKTISEGFDNSKSQIPNNQTNPFIYCGTRHQFFNEGITHA